jgi:hypothetical protein
MKMGGAGSIRSDDDMGGDGGGEMVMPCSWVCRCLVELMKIKLTQSYNLVFNTFLYPKLFAYF